MSVVGSGSFGTELEKLMKKENKTIRDMAAETGATYEHIRKLVRGVALPSPMLLNSICKALDWDIKKAQQLVAAEGMIRKYGSKAPSSMLPGGIDASVLEFRTLIPRLTDDQRRMFKLQMEAVVSRNKE